VTRLEEQLDIAGRARTLLPQSRAPYCAHMKLRYADGRESDFVLGGIFRDKALATGGIRKVFSDFELLGGFTAGTYVFRNDFIKKNPDTVRTFVSGVGKAIEWARTTPHDQVLARLTKIVQSRGRNENADALKYWKSYGVAGKGGVVADKEFGTWITWLEQQGQIPKGKVKASDIYTNKYNSFAAGGQ